MKSSKDVTSIGKGGGILLTLNRTDGTAQATRGATEPESFILESMKESLKDSEEERRKKRRKGRRREETWERRRRKKRNNSLIGALQIEDFLQENPERG